MAEDFDDDKGGLPSGDSFTEETGQSWFGRLGDAFKGIIIGLILFLLGFPLLFWNEGRAIKTYQALKEGAGIVVSTSPDKIDPAKEGKLVHLTGKATTEETLSDPEFAVSAVALRLGRVVEMYQWRENKKSETEKQVGGGTKTKTTYTYEKEWSNNRTSSDNFKVREGHVNPSMIYQSKDLTAQKVTLGAFAMSPGLVNKIDKFEPLRLEGSAASPKSVQDKAKLFDGYWYIGKDPQTPAVGDLRVKFQVIKPLTVSVVAKQVQNTFEPYVTTGGKDLELLQVGAVSAATMFAAAQRENIIISWLIRLGGALLFFVGLLLILKPISVVMDVLPLLGNIAEAGIGLVSLLLALACALITIAVAWLYYRPLLAALLIAGAVALIWGISRLRRPKPAAA